MLTTVINELKHGERKIKHAKMIENKTKESAKFLG